MFALAVSFGTRLRDPSAVLRGLLAGVTWGLTLTAALTLLTAWQWGGVCIDETLWIATLSVPAGILAIGPIALFGRR
jgi:hypothetical protein